MLGKIEGTADGTACGLGTAVDDPNDGCADGGELKSRDGEVDKTQLGEFDGRKGSELLETAVGAGVGDGKADGIVLGKLLPYEGVKDGRKVLGAGNNGAGNCDGAAPTIGAELGIDEGRVMLGVDDLP